MWWVWHYSIHLLVCWRTPKEIRNFGIIYNLLPEILSIIVLAVLLLISFQWVVGNVLILHHQWCQGPSIHNPISVSDRVGGLPVDVRCLDYTSQRHTISATREPSAFIAFFFPPPVISPLISSSLISFFSQQSITTTPGERRSCPCRSETRCTYWRHMNVRTGLLMTSVS